MYGHLALHAPTADKREEARAIMTDVGERVFAGADGLISYLTGEEAGTGRLFGMSIWQTREQCEAVLPAVIEAVMSTPIHSWATQPAQLIRFTELDEQA
jgi:hypothetical protein